MASHQWVIFSEFSEKRTAFIFSGVKLKQHHTPEKRTP
jgi:hypothetical protein